MRDGSDGSASPVDIAGYIAELTGELADLARSRQLDLLAYLLDIAEREARLTAEANDSG